MGLVRAYNEAEAAEDRDVGGEVVSPETFFAGRCDASEREGVGRLTFTVVGAVGYTLGLGIVLD
jgi:hypothetical protein